MVSYQNTVDSFRTECTYVCWYESHAAFLILINPPSAGKKDKKIRMMVPFAILAMCSLPIITNIATQIAKETQYGITVDYNNIDHIRDARVRLRQPKDNEKIGR